MSCWCKQQGLEGGCSNKFDYSVIRPEELVDGALVVLKRDPTVDLKDYTELVKGIRVLAEQTQGKSVNIGFLILDETGPGAIRALDGTERATLLAFLLKDTA